MKNNIYRLGKKLFKHDYTIQSGRKKLEARLEVTTKGFTLWLKHSKKGSHWVIDSSCLEEDATVRLAKVTENTWPDGFEIINGIDPSQKIELKLIHTKRGKS